MKTLKFRDHLSKLVISGEKDCTWRLFDDKNLMQGDDVVLINSDTKEEFGKGKIISIRQKKIGELTPADYEGHEKFQNDQEMLQTYKSYYGDRVTLETIVKIIKFELEK